MKENYFKASTANAKEANKAILGVQNALLAIAELTILSSRIFKGQVDVCLKIEVLFIALISFFDAEYFKPKYLEVDKKLGETEHVYLLKKEVVSGPFGSTLKSE
ncbi:MAG: hypothetical protein A6F72_09480 [Cycloclasticus sp. symbiont of Poecilosclerida sp. N]|nr:MAG: hypothetical protein A6F72_09480 [Cycloclasticus sp. symbiont of Poecilosclerida sp. N]